MIRIEELFPTPTTVVLQIEGKLDRFSLPTLQEVCSRHFDAPRPQAVSLDTRDLQSISIEGKNYFRKIQKKVTFLNLPEFLRLELDANSR